MRPIPKSRAKTAWGLCAEVIKAVLSEPRRVDMGTTICVRDPELDHGAPACGTVGCFAGWIVLLHDGRENAITNHPKGASSFIRLNTLSRAEQILQGHSRDYYVDEDDIINFHTVGPIMDEYVFNGGQGDACGKTEPGTKKHALAVVSRIKKFMRVNEKALKARKL